ARDGQRAPRRTLARAAQVAAKPAARSAAVVPQGRPKATERRRSITLSVTSTPRATVFIDGARVGETPITGRALTVGRSYQIRVERKGYRTKREKITATGNRPLRRSYTLQKDGRR
ncbi:MAG: PEGA domain-containing protein, partial [Gemmatimonadota bacterium]|nr:PEGA domain-containing protein [Gemmatimonadota bacterium]